jgi:hypothetical protein
MNPNIMAHHLLKTIFIFGCLSIVACGNEDDDSNVNNLLLLGRFEGWEIESVTSNYGERAEEVIANLPDSVLVAADTTRAGLLADYLEIVEGVTGVQPCEMDDALLFADQGVVVQLEGESCPADSPPHVLTPFNRTRNTSDLEVTRLQTTDPDGGTMSVYTVPELNETTLVLEQTRVVPAGPILPEFSYDISYRFRAR